jgi:hypothetical protein
MARALRLAAVLSPVVFSIACARPSSQGATTLADNASDIVGCENFQSNFYDQLYQFPQTKTALPTEQEMRAAFAKSVSASRLQNLSASDQARVSDELTALYKLLAVDSLTKLRQENATSQQKLATLAALEIGDSSTPEKEELQAQIKQEFSKIDLLVSGTQGTCAKPPSNTGAPTLDASHPSADASQANTLFSQWKATRPRVIYGALKAMSVAYQSCDVGLLPALTTQTADAVGITDYGLGPDGIGHRRLITNITDLFKTHPYLQSYRKPSASCLDVTKNLPIYDYGGRPVTTNGTFDLFKNAGSGTAALGTDCSGYVFMSIAASGLRVKKATALKAVTINGINSTLFTNPQKNGLTCFDYTTFKNNDTLRAGDIIAKAGHIVMVESVGSDPFGLKDIKQASDCTLGNMAVSRFDFTVLQDSPDKGGIGIQASRAADYLPSEQVMPQGLLEAAVTACKAKFGTIGTAKNDKIAIVRHDDSSACMNASEIKMEQESCVASCPAQPALSQQLASAPIN